MKFAMMKLSFNSKRYNYNTPSTATVAAGGTRFNSKRYNYNKKSDGDEKNGAEVSIPKGTITITFLFTLTVIILSFNSKRYNYNLALANYLPYFNLVSIPKGTITILG